MLQSMRSSRRRRPVRFKSSLGLMKLPERSYLPSSARSLRTQGWKRFNPFRLFRKRRLVFSWRKLLIWLAGAFIVLIVAISGIFAYYVRDLPNPKKLALAPVQSTQIFDRTGKPLYSFHGEENRTIIKADEISP